MAINRNDQINAQAVRKTKVETTYEYVPILGQILGYWRRIEVTRAGDSVELHIATPLSAYDRLLINGRQIEIPRDAEL